MLSQRVGQTLLLGPPPAGPPHTFLFFYNNKLLIELVIILARGVLLFIILSISPRKELSREVGGEIKGGTSLLLIHKGWIRFANPACSHS